MFDHNFLGRKGVSKIIKKWQVVGVESIDPSPTLVGLNKSNTKDVCKKCFQNIALSVMQVTLHFIVICRKTSPCGC